MSGSPFDAYYFFSGYLYDNALYYAGIVVADMKVAFFTFIALLHLLPLHDALVARIE
jgi:hypothetical protein